MYSLFFSAFNCLNSGSIAVQLHNFHSIAVQLHNSHSIALQLHNSHGIFQIEGTNVQITCGKSVQSED
jgi:hypothetical protein